MSACSGSFRVCLSMSVLANERKVSDVGTKLGLQNKLFDVLCKSVQVWPDPVPAEVKMETDEDGYWVEKAGKAEVYICDVVYSGIDGYAYVRSLGSPICSGECTLHRSRDIALSHLSSSNKMENPQCMVI